VQSAHCESADGGQGASGSSSASRSVVDAAGRRRDRGVQAPVGPSCAGQYGYGASARTDSTPTPVREHTLNGNGITFDRACPGG